MNAKKKYQRTLFQKIVNFFIAVFAVIIVLILIFIGYSQTSSFRELLRTKVIDEANSSINGKLNIEKIEGTIFTSLFLRNTTLVNENDTLISIGNLEFKISPMQLLLKKLYIRKIVLANVNFNLLEDENGVWNLSKLAKDETEDEEDSTSSELPFTIQVNELNLHNINFTRKTFTNRNKNYELPKLDFDNLIIQNLNISASLSADINNNNYALLLQQISFHPNFGNFNLKSLSGFFEINQNYAGVRNLVFLSDSSSIELSAKLDGLNLFGGTTLEEFENYPMNLELAASPFYFNDLSAFIEGTEILKGRPLVYLQASGKFGEVDIKRLNMQYEKTIINASGKLYNLNTPGKMYLDVLINNSTINYTNVLNLLPSLELPVFENLLVEDLNIDYKGEPTKFKTKLKGNLAQGSLDLNAFLNLQRKEIEYDVNFNTKNINLKPVIDIESKITSTGKIKGKSFDPTKIEAAFDFRASNSVLNGYRIDSLNVTSNGSAKIIDLNLRTIINNALANVNGKLDFTDEETPAYDLTGNLSNLNLAAFFEDSSYSSSLNFDFNAVGKDLDIDSMNGLFNIQLDSSIYRGKLIESSELKLELVKESSERKINLVSDFVDFKITGDFLLSQAIDLVSYEAVTISKIISKKINELNPVNIVKEGEDEIDETELLPDFLKSNLTFNYEFEFKDFELIALILNNDKLDVNGRGEGKIQNTETHFTVSSEIYLDYLLNIDDEDVIYLSEVNGEINFSRDNRSSDFDKLFGTLSLTGNRVYFGSELNSVNADLIFNQSKLFFNLETEYEKYLRAQAEGTVTMSALEQKINFEQMVVNYEGIVWNNKEQMTLTLSPDSVTFNNFDFVRGVSSVSFNGTTYSNGSQDLKIFVNNLTGDVFGKYFFQIEDDYIESSLNLEGNIKGKFSAPVMDFNVNMNNITYNNVKLGNLICNASYLDKNISSKLVFVDSTYNVDKPLLVINGNIPIDLNFNPVEERINTSQFVDLSLISNGFNLNSLGNLIPEVANQSGELNANIKIGGYINNLTYNGTLKIDNGSFKSLLNYLDYNFTIDLSSKGNEIIINDLQISNAGDTKYSGTIKGTGDITLSGFTLDKINTTLNGDISLLGNKSKAANPNLYGDLFVSTDGNLIYKYENERSFVHGKILLEETNLTYASAQVSTSTFQNEFIYEFLIDSSKIDREKLKFDRLVANGEDKKNNTKDLNKTKSNFDYDIEIEVNKNAQIKFIFAQAFRLSAEAVGSFRFSRFNGVPRALGQFTLVGDSKLEFFKTFKAEGSLRFESDIYDPFINVVATYRNNYEGDASNQEVAVKIRINSSLNNLGKNITGDENFIAVFVGKQNIENNSPSLQYDDSDAVSFILLGKFISDNTLSSEDQQQAAGQIGSSTASTVLGPLLSNFANSVVGDFINDIQFSQTASNYNLQVSGRLQNVRYSLGGTGLFQDINRANLRFEYLFNPKFLIRLERKDPVVQSSSLDDKINELALKYKFEF